MLETRAAILGLSTEPFQCPKHVIRADNLSDTVYNQNAWLGSEELYLDNLQGMESMAEGRETGFSAIPLKDKWVWNQLSNSKSDPFWWHHFSIITEQVFVLVINTVHLPLHRQETENVRQISYLAPFPSLRFSKVITIHRSYLSACVATVAKQLQQLLLWWLVAGCAEFLSNCSNTLSLP